METKEYIVALNKGVDYDQFWADMENPTSGLPHIPDRVVSIMNNRDMMMTLCHYALTDDEAKRVRNDSRVAGVDLPIEHIPELIVGPVTARTGNFNKPTWFTPNTNVYIDSTGSNLNWGLIRHSYQSNKYTIGTYSTDTTSYYNYVADGTGIDVIITDTGIEYYHPEFTDSSGNTRVVQYNWTGSLNTSVGSVNFKDEIGHGTHVTGTVAGKTFGWAGNAIIYPMKIALSGVTGGVPITTMFDNIKSFHLAKTNSRPTVVNMSWGTSIDGYSSLILKSINYRTTGNVQTSTADPSKGLVPGPTSNEYGYPITWPGSIPYRYTPLDNAIQELVDAGIIVCIAAGNNAHKIDVPDGVDYNNYFVSNLSLSGNSYVYYHRGSSPYSANAIMVGALDSTTYNSTLDKKVAFSAAGPGVDIYAAGYGIRSATSNVTTTSGANLDSAYYLNSNFKQLTEQGTSMASPQVAGICSLYLQANPTATPAQVKTWLLTNADGNIYANTANISANDYTNTSSIWGGNARVAYQAVQGLTRIKDATGDWKYVANVKVKTDATTWSNVRAIWNKDFDTGDWRQVF